MPSNKYPLPILRLPNNIRAYLSYPHGLVILAQLRGGVFKCDLTVDCLVGDIVSTSFKGRLKIMDQKTRRHNEIRRKNILKTCNYLVINPRGAISQNARTIMSLPLDMILVFGEEDLLTMVASEDKTGKKIAYGYPGYGAIITFSDTIKTRRLLKRFKPDIVFLNKVNTEIMRER